MRGCHWHVIGQLIREKGSNVKDRHHEYGQEGEAGQRIETHWEAAVSRHHSCSCASASRSAGRDSLTSKRPSSTMRANPGDFSRASRSVPLAKTRPSSRKASWSTSRTVDRRWATMIVVTLPLKDWMVFETLSSVSL